MNLIVLLGRVTTDMELRQTSTGKSVANFNLAVDRPFAKDTTDFFSVVVWDKTAETMAKLVKKGQKILVRGSLQNREWTDKQGNKRISAEVVVQEFFFCESKGTAVSNNIPNTVSAPQAQIPTSYTAPQEFETVETDSDLPF